MRKCDDVNDAMQCGDMCLGKGGGPAAAGAGAGPRGTGPTPPSC